MKNKILLFTVLGALVFSACTTSYKSTQTPDDVYYSPLRELKDAEQEEYLSNDDNRIRMAVKNPRWRYSDWDYDYDYNPYRYGYGYGYYYNPYYYPYPVYTGFTIRNPVNSTIRTGNLATYTPPTVTVKDPKTGKVTTTRGYQYNQNNNTNTRRVIRNNNTDYNNSGNNRTYSPSSSGSTTRPGSTPVSRPPRP